MKKILIICLAVLLLIDGGLFLSRYLSNSKPALSIIPEPTLLATPTATTIENTQKILEGYDICIDPGHGITNQTGQESIAPGVSETKPKHVSGASGKVMTEEELNLQIAIRLKEKLEENGASIRMTRTSAACDLSNIERAELGNQSRFVIRIHADGNEDPDVNGISMLVPSGEYINNADMLLESKKLGESILSQVIKYTNAKNRGIIERSDLTGFNWSKVPVVLLEVGFITNPEEETKLKIEEYQNQIVQGIIDGIQEYITPE